MSLDASINSLENVDSEQHWINLIWRNNRNHQVSSLAKLYSTKYSN